MSADTDPPPPPRCAHCGEVIGVYEPYALRLDGAVHLASRASTPEPPADATLYHADCYERIEPA